VQRTAADAYRKQAGEAGFDLGSLGGEPKDRKVN